MISEIPLHLYRSAQNIARKTMKYLAIAIRKEISEAHIVELAENYMRKMTPGEFWYHGKGALVLIGQRTIISVPGKEYHPDECSIVTEEDIVTVDLSPSVKDCWGDYARTFIISKGRVAKMESENDELFLEYLWRGLRDIQKIHSDFLEWARPEMKFGEIFAIVSDKLYRLGYRILDYKQNIGHTIEKKLDDRRFINEGSELTLKDAKIFTLEPHIAGPDFTFTKRNIGLKMENIYICEGNKIVEL
jgi:Xaa-Pro aminopeptidase